MWLLSILITIAVLLILVLGLRFVENLESENRAIEAQLYAAQIYDKALEERMREMRRFRHDVNGLLQAIEHESMARVASVDLGTDGTCQAPNREQDSLVGSLVELKRAQCGSAGIAFSSDVDDGWRAVVQKRDIEEVDVQAVVQNLLQNAYEASLEVFPESDRLIEFRMGDRDGKLCIEVVNRTASNEAPTFKTTKSNPEQHGIGLQVVGDIASVYGGDKNAVFDSQARLHTMCVVL